MEAKLIGKEDCKDLAVPVACSECGEMFDLSRDFKEYDCDSVRALKEKCGASELKCYHCRDCKE